MHDTQRDSAAGLHGCIHTSGFPELLRELGCCLVVSTYQAGKLVVLSPQGDSVRTHARRFHRPMGLAADRGRLVLGAMTEIVDFRQMPGIAHRLHDPLLHDAVYMARRGHVTGHVDIHELAWDAGGDIWFVNTLFSCLCTLDARSSFVPRWRPAFVSCYAAEDRCHLNGLAMRDGAARYVTALGETDTREGWRGNRHDGGVLVDVTSDAVIARGLSMPHSPRWYDGRLWLLESGRGALCTVDIETGARTDVARVPGFCRGLDFVGPVAFIGVSQRRDSGAAFDMPLDDAERLAGVWAVHVRSGETLGRFTFASDVQEVFAVQTIEGVLHPEIVADGELLDIAHALPEGG